jgi:sugar lactone lactonase YvrE
VAADSNRCGESPIWDGERGRLLWTGVEGARVYQHVPATGETSVVSRGISVAGIALGGAGELLFGGADGLSVWRGAHEVRPLVHIGAKGPRVTR